MPATVLIVDDSKLARIVASKVLTALQPEWRRIEAANAAEALTIVAKQTVDAALIDFNMADKDGLALATELRAAFPSLPIAIITANTQDELINRAHAIDAAFVAKPVTAAGLEGFLSSVARRLHSKTA